MDKLAHAVLLSHSSVKILLTIIVYIVSCQLNPYTIQDNIMRKLILINIAK